MNSKKIIFSLVAILLIGSAQLLTAVPAHADNPVLNLDANGNLVISPPTTDTCSPSTTPTGSGHPSRYTSTHHSECTPTITGYNRSSSLASF